MGGDYIKQLFINNIVRMVKRADILLISICFILSSISIFLLKSISNSFALNDRIVVVQTIASLIGIFLAISLANIKYSQIASLWKFYVPITLILVILTFFIGSQRGNADDKAWIMLPMGMSFQPSEFLKVAFILSFSLHLHKVGSDIKKMTNIILLCLHGAIPIFLIHLQGDDGAALMFIIIFVCMIFSAGLSWKYILPAVGLVGVCAPLIWYFMNSDQKMRVLVTLNPGLDPHGIGYQQFTGLVSIGNGGILGKGLFMDKYYFVPEIQNDFILSFIGQSLGYVGTVFILGLLIAISIRILVIGLKCVDNLGKYICVGVFGMIIAQVIFNVGMNLSVLPVIGITLPLLSSGGSSIITVYAGIGLALSVYSFNRKTLFI